MATPPRRRGPRAPAGFGPTLTGKGRAFGFGGLLGIAIGVAAAAPLAVALGLVQIFALAVLYLRFYPTAICLWRRQLEITWRTRPGSGRRHVVGARIPLDVRLHNQAPRPLSIVELRVVSSSALVAQPAFTMVPANEEVSLTFEITANSVGHLFLHGAAIKLLDPLRLFAIEAYFPGSVAVDVWPRAAVNRVAPRRSATGKQGESRPRLLGHGGELREIRAFHPGDPFRHIAWKATVRTGRLMVRELDRPTVESWLFLLDVCPSMRAGIPGSRPLDAAIEEVAAYALPALTEGVRVGLCAFAREVVFSKGPAGGAAQRRHLLEALLTLSSPVEEALTTATRSELFGLVARYLHIQEGIDVHVRRAPPRDDPRWSRLAVTPSGELVDLDLLFTTIHSLLPMQPTAPAPDPFDSGRLRQFCRARGIELSSIWGAGGGQVGEGLREALSWASTPGPPRRIILVSDMDFEMMSTPKLAAVLHGAKRRGHEISRLVFDFHNPPVTQDPVEAFLARARRTRGRQIDRRFRAHGVHRFDEKARRLG